MNQSLTKETTRLTTTSEIKNTSTSTSVTHVVNEHCFTDGEVDNLYKAAVINVSDLYKHFKRSATNNNNKPCIVCGKLVKSCCSLCKGYDGNMKYKNLVGVPLHTFGRRQRLDKSLNESDCYFRYHAMKSYYDNRDAAQDRARQEAEAEINATVKRKIDNLSKDN